MRILGLLIFVVSVIVSIGCQQQQPQPMQMYPQQTNMTCQYTGAINCAGLGPAVVTPYPTTVGSTGVAAAPPVLPIGPYKAASGASTTSSGVAAQKLANAMKTSYNVNLASGAVSPASGESIGVARLPDATRADSNTGSSDTGAGSASGGGLEDKIARNISSVGAAPNSGDSSGQSPQFESFVRHEDFTDPNNTDPGTSGHAIGVGSAQ